jgi:hypothetical protein
MRQKLNIAHSASQYLVLEIFSMIQIFELGTAVSLTRSIMLLAVLATYLSSSVSKELLRPFEKWMRMFPGRN